jgi:two-component system cell cycle sensor histidine kinase/response regulator CckA
MADLIKEEIPKSHACQEKAETIAQTAQRCSSLLSTSIPAKAQSLEKKEEFNFIPLVKEVIGLVACTPQLKVKFDVKHERGKVIINGNKSEISSALMNLYLNAIEAMPDGGILHINTHLTGETDVSNKIMTKAEEYILVEIKDTGIGILPENIPHIFEPHFTTKCSLKKKNLGMGLWRVQQCVVKHGGSIHVNSSLGKGTTFTLKLPVVSTLEKQNSKAIQCKSKISLKKRVIVIDNDETIRDVITMMLNNAQIDVIAHPNSDSAISWISEHIGYVNVAIVEHTYPFCDGIKCIKTLKAIDPDLKYILISDITCEPLHIISKEVFLLKPFLKKELFTAINSVMTENNHQV